MKALEGKTAIVTGASRGIGAQIARRLAGAGARVVVNYASRRDAADAVVAEIEGTGGEAVAFRADVARAAEVAALFDAAVERFGTLHILVNNAGVILYKLLEEMTDEGSSGSGAST